MDLLDRYLASLELSLNVDNKNDVIREIKANILDELEARVAEGENKDFALNAILVEHGHPLLAAQQYAPQPPLVAGEDMPLYKTVLWHSAALVFVFSLLQTVSSMLQSDSINPLRLLFQTTAHFIDHVGFIVLLVTVIFYLLGKHGMLSSLRYRAWTPAKLPQFPQTKLSLSDTITDLFSVAFLLLILWTPLWMTASAQQNLLLTLAPDFEYWRIILTVLSVFSGLFALYRLSQNTWKRWSLMAYIADHFLFGVAFLWMASQNNVLLLASSEMRNSWPQLSLIVESNLSNFLFITGAIIIVLGVLQAVKLKRLS